MNIDKFEDSITWQKAQNLAVIIYKLFKNNKDFGFRDQIQRAVVSISNNIAEGFERKSDNELRQFLYIAKGSCGEVRSMAYLAVELKYIDESDFDKIHDLSIEVSKMLFGFINKL